MTEELKRQVLEANLTLQAAGLVIFTWGNVSAIDRATQEVVIKPSGVPYAGLTLDKLVVCSLEGEVLSGGLRPSSDLMTHLELYRAFPECMAVAHTHSRVATAWAQAGRDLPALGTTHADHFYGPVPCTRALTEQEILGEYEKNTGLVIAETFALRGLDAAAVQAALVNGHGPFTWGKNAMESVTNAVVLEEVAAMACATLALSPELGGVSQALLDKHYFRKHGKNAYYGQGH